MNPSKNKFVKAKKIDLNPYHRTIALENCSLYCSIRGKK